MATTKVCKECGKVFTAERGNRKYCSETCSRLWNAKQSYTLNPEKIKKRNAKNSIYYPLIALYGGKCALCGWRATAELVTVKGRTQYAYGNELHHIDAVEDGGETTAENLILLCPNHHKQANLGLISKEELRQHLKPYSPPTDADRAIAKANCTDAIAAAIFGE